MKRPWRVRRQAWARPDGQRRWDCAYQTLLARTATRPGPKGARRNGGGGRGGGRGCDRVRGTARDRRARNYVHQMLLLDELQRQGCQVEFLERPMSQDPHDQLLLQICGAVAEYERTLIAERMRRGRL